MRAKPIIIFIAVMAMLFMFFPLKKVLSQTSPDSLEDALRAQSGGDMELAYHSETGMVRFIGAASGRSLWQNPAAAQGVTPEQAARTFLSEYGSLFGLRDQDRELAVLRESASGDRSFVRFQQMYKDIPILAGELVVQLDRGMNVISASGESLPDLGINTQPSISAEAARATALALISKAYDLPSGELETSEPELWIFNPALLGGPGLRFNRLVWRMEVVNKGLVTLNELVLVDAHLGAVALHFNQIDSLLDRKIYDNNNVVGADLPGSTLRRSEGQAATGDADVDKAYTYSGDTYNFYLTNHSRDSIDGKGMSIISTVRVCTTAEDCPMDNAFWNGKQMVYGEGYASADDVVAHEMTHGVTKFSSGLFYYMQSGGVNEAFSDIWGEFVDQANGDSGERWLMGEDLAIGAIRSMKDPTLYANPDKMTSEFYACGSADRGGVHTNSGVGNKAVYLMVDGGTFNGKTVAPLGLAKTDKIWYRVQNNMLTSGGDYKDLYNNVLQACTDLIGSNGITAADCAQAKNALDAVEMTIDPPGCAAPEAPVCPAGQYPNYLFQDDVENPNSGKWVHGPVSGTVDHWYYPINPNPVANGLGPYASSGRNNIWGYDFEQIADFYLAMKNPIALPAGSTPYFRFNHATDFEVFKDGEGTTHMIDGGVIEYSTDNGATWLDAGTAFPTENGYNGTLTGLSDNPLKNRKGFVSETNGYISTRLNLASKAGQSIRFRFRLGTDGSGWDYGWFIDDIGIYTCGQTAGPTNTPIVAGPSPTSGPGPAPAGQVFLVPFLRNGSHTGGGNPVPTATQRGQQVPTATNTYVPPPNTPTNTPLTPTATNTPLPTATKTPRPPTETPIPNQLVNGNFEQGRGKGWIEASTRSRELVLQGDDYYPDVTPYEGSWMAALYAYDLRETSQISQQVALPAGQNYLNFAVLIKSFEYCGPDNYDWLTFYVNEVDIDTTWLCGASWDMSNWGRYYVDLSAYSGQTITLTIEAGTGPDGGGTIVYMDDLSIDALPQ